MILDSSVIVSIVLEEQGYEEVWDRVLSAEAVRVGAPTLVESGMVVRSRLGRSGRVLLDAAIAQLSIDSIPFDDRHWPVALDAFARFGKGNHPAALNLGDCLAYATARVAREPLLCLGHDFAQTDLELA